MMMPAPQMLMLFLNYLWRSLAKAARAALYHAAGMGRVTEPRLPGRRGSRPCRVTIAPPEPRRSVRPKPCARNIDADASPIQAASCFRDGWIRISAGIPNVSCSRRIIAMERRRLRNSTSASYPLASSGSAMVGIRTWVALSRA